MISTEIISSNQIQKAAKLIKMGELVIFPTETVYGIGANAYNEDAVKMIFLVKKRPIENPLIVHVDTVKKIKELSEYIPKSALMLIKKFSPGPLTYVLKKSIKISRFISGNLDTVAIRIPANKIALNLIKASKVPIAAPSANISKRPSSTSFEMALKELNGLVRGIIKTENKDFNIGIESTVIGFDLKDNVLILRPGAITKKMLEKELKGKYTVNYAETKIELEKSPGNIIEHYKPKIPVYLFKSQDNIRRYLNKDTKILITKPTLKSYLFNFLWDKKNIKVFNTLEEYAQNLYKELVNSESSYKQILSEFVKDEGLGYSINNRIKKASSNRFI
ncbi:L-threonylcarbamoyladenylate synthase [Borreliella spielmanii]|uniref:Threonylcarbamoyl-AMP synthase n=1 Tax=Borreliella spielmanii TaxID=88916 RepID=A0ABR6P5A0_9SPIR|nr:L-threonylcarbamoyladenylate synthase [Borreliella spielmanii]MBB6031145.1 L-threonylcarbamoyladenylate synthase [Borreliella spielmanii]